MRFFIIFIFLVPLASFSQSEASIWYFGEKAGIEFNPDGSTIPLLDGQLSTLKGCASLSDINGEILFYTDGITVYNKNHQVMLNGTGLTGHLFSTQSVTVIQKPGSSLIFYIFTIDAVAKTNGLRYSEIDLTLDGGLGGVTSAKNIALYAPTCG